ncbi:MAG: hypothetical protein A2218_08960 [Elusimicrobia bacterium RIFOXYA2_FULL_53_38]|nr:MAG: hypothetical protein A2218_08960 [Elusimicrobia bacterium RIFOXYA2_FULL_53_38]
MNRYPVKITVLSCVSFFFVTNPSVIHAIDIQERYDSAFSEINSYLKDTKQNILPAAAGLDVPPVPEYIGFNYDVNEMLSNGAISRNFSGHTVYVKFLFLRGDYDSYTQTYKGVPAVSVYDESTSLMGKLILSGESRKFTFKDLSLYVGFAGKTITLKNNNVPSESVTLQYEDLLSAWAANAEKHCSMHLAAKYCFVPQYYLDGAHHYGFVVSANTPLYYTTGIPQDFVELYKTENGDTSFKPIAFSLSLRSAFVLSPGQKYIWEFRPMTAEEVGEAMVNRTKPLISASISLTRSTIANVKN